MAAGQVKKQFTVDDNSECKVIHLQIKSSSGDCYIKPSNNPEILNVYSNQAIGALSPWGFSSEVAHLPEHGVSLAVLSNRPLGAVPLRALGSGLLRRVTGHPPSDDPGAPAAWLLRLLSSPFALLAFGLVPATLWSCVGLLRRPRKLDRYAWWLSYHLSGLAMAYVLTAYQNHPWHPLLLGWGLAMTSGALWARWWRLPAPQSIKNWKSTLRLGAFGLAMAVLCFISPDHLQHVFAAVCAGQLLVLTTGSIGNRFRVRADRSLAVNDVDSAAHPGAPNE
jgi:hypothetical protein